MKPDSKNIVLKFDSSSLTHFQELLENHILRVEEILSLDGSDDERMVSNSLLELEKEHSRTSSDSLKQFVSMLELAQQTVNSNVNALIEFVKRVDSAEGVLTQRAVEINEIIKGEKSGITSGWDHLDVIDAKKILLHIRYIAIELASFWAEAMKKLLINFEFAVPPSLHRVLKKRRQRKIIGALSWIGLVLTLIAFAPILAIPAGIAAVIWFFVERRFFTISDLKELKSEGRFLKETKNSVDLALRKVRAFRVEVAPWDAESFAELVAPVLVPLENNTPPDMLRMEALKKALESTVKEMNLNPPQAT